jgi:DNA helicase-2/ATP-dependent DNA helicase PcrA
LCCAKKIKGLNNIQKESASHLGELLKEMSDKVDIVPLHNIMRDILERSGYIYQLETERTPESITRMENLDELLASMKLFSDAGGTVSEYLEQYALITEQDTYDAKKDACALMTLHAAKGLEFRVVFLVGMEEGLLPHARSIGDEIQMEEERRLCYVGMTRAKEYLYLTFAANRQNYAGPSQSQVSRFIADIPFDSLNIRTWQDV